MRLRKQRRAFATEYVSTITVMGSSSRNATTHFCGEMSSPCLGLYGDSADDVCQETWIEVAKRIRSFVYDTRGTFRGWLWKVCHHEERRIFLNGGRPRARSGWSSGTSASGSDRNSVDLDELTEERRASSPASDEKENAARKLVSRG